MFKTIEKYVEGKRRDKNLCEDLIYDGKYFKAVIDGATSKTLVQKGKYSAGRTIANSIKETLAKLKSNIEVKEAFNFINQEIANNIILKEYFNADQYAEKPSASVAILSLYRNEIWKLGDPNIKVDGKRFSNVKKIDGVVSEFRSLYNTLMLNSGHSTNDLLGSDLGRSAILPVLEKQAIFQNNLNAGEYGYGTLDGSSQSIDFIEVIDVSKANDIIIATDGYPVILENLDYTEAALKRILTDDPLMIGKFKSTKAMLNGFLSFDDRAIMFLKRSE